MSIKSIKERMEALQAEVRALGHEGMMAEFREFFDKNPEITGLAWTQYAPHFNDGDACVFSVHEIHYTTTKDPKEAFDDFEGYSECENSGEGFVDISWSEAKRSPLDNRVDAFWGEIVDDNIFETILGSDCKVLVTPLGITVEDVSHD